MKQILNQLRPVMWSSKEVVIYKGPIPVNRLHLHRALQVIISPSANLQISQGDIFPQTSGNVAVIPPFARHHVSSTLAPALVLFYEPNATILTRFKRSFVKIEKLVSHQSESAAKLILNFPANISEVINLGNEILQVKHSDFLRPICDDPRIEEIVRRMENIHEPAIRLHDVAGDFQISESRLIHLFSEQIQMPFKSYYLWLKLRKALHLISSGLDLTTSAHEAGFTDSAHFSRTFVATFGFPPSHLKLIKMISS